MGSHLDRDHAENPSVKSVLERLSLKAEILEELGKNRVTNDRVLEEWTVDGLRVQMLPDDPDGVLRISIGSHPEFDRSSYCNFRGDQSKCIALLVRAVVAMKSR